MKKLLFILIAISIIACKKEDLKPQELTVEKIVSKTDTLKIKDTVKIKDIVVIHDTIYKTPDPLLGVWNLYKIEKVINGVKTVENPNWVFKWSYTEVIETKNGIVNTYKVNFTVDHIDIYDNGLKPTVYVHSAINQGKEYKLFKKPDSNGNYEIWYFKR